MDLVNIWAVGYYNIDDEFVLADLELSEAAAADSALDHEDLFDRPYVVEPWAVARG